MTRLIYKLLGISLAVATAVALDVATEEATRAAGPETTLREPMEAQQEPEMELASMHQEQPDTTDNNSAALSLERLSELAADDEPFDDRTLLDVFGEVAKEYLSQKVIPDTDAECRWDWRSIRCEPACDCHFYYQTGDYHLGRSCRRRSDDDRDADCQAVDPARLLRDQPAAKRFLSLAAQTSDIVRDKVGRWLQVLMKQPGIRFHRYQTQLCDELWTLRAEFKCLPKGQVPIKSLPERLWCGPVEWPECDDDDDIAKKVFAEVVE